MEACLVNSNVAARFGVQKVQLENKKDSEGMEVKLEIYL